MRRATALVVVLAASLAGCGPKPEEPVLAEFFNASRLRDRHGASGRNRNNRQGSGQGRDGHRLTVKGVEAREAAGRATEGRVNLGAGQARGRADGRKAAGGVVA